MVGSILGIVATLLPYFVKVVENLFPEKGTGTIKKENVKDAVVATVSGWAAVSKGGQKETADAVAKILSTPVTSDGKDIIDFTAGYMFPNEGSQSIVNLNPS